MQDQLAALRSRQGRHQEAIELAREALLAYAKGASPQARAEAQRQLGAVLLAANRPEDAIAPLREALTLLKENELGVSPAQTEVADELGRAEHAPQTAKTESAVSAPSK